MKLFLLVALMAVALSQPLEISADNDTALWELFKIENSKVYFNDQKEHEKKSIFFKNLNFIREHNAKFQKGEVSYDVAINKFADMTAEEFHKVMGLQKVSTEIPTTGKVFNVTEYIYIPETVDWRIHGAVTAIKNQGVNCNSGWAFSTTGTLEGQIFLRTNTLISLSEQNILDCSHHGRNHGCHGGNVIDALYYVSENEGIDTEDFYPYLGKDDTICHYNEKYKAAPSVKVNSPSIVTPQGDEFSLKIAVATVGPISVSIGSTPFENGFSTLQFYKSGIYFDRNCSKINPNHNVLVVGYGTLPQEYPSDYWLIKNSWGTDWGMEGYMMTARNNENMCAIADYGLYPNVNYISEGH